MTSALLNGHAPTTPVSSESDTDTRDTMTLPSELATPAATDDTTADNVAPRQKRPRFAKIRARIADTRDIATELLATGDTWQTQWLIYGGLSAAVIANIVLSFMGLYDYAHRVMHLSPWVAWLVPVGIDALSLGFMGLTYRMRNAKWHERLYMWLLYFAPTLCSVGANAKHADHRGWSTDAVVVYGLFPVFASLGLHALVFARRKTERAKKRVTRRQATRQPVVPAATPPVTPAPTVATPGSDTVTTARRDTVATLSHSDDGDSVIDWPKDPRQAARHGVALGMTGAAIHRALVSLGREVPSKRTFERYVEREVATP